MASPFAPFVMHACSIGLPFGFCDSITSNKLGKPAGILKELCLGPQTHRRHGRHEAITVFAIISLPKLCNAGTPSCTGNDSR
eukprot:COSAG05_NODE_179_length_14870_cov_351.155846_13_plen_82_part_00